ncbi:hypothetical protein [Microcoleus sp. OTE_8_concoct_300]|uniref:hypothetical protein n=1 Tax=Microcoleus sp. OTE_8_concoct_300 TaxID=2964710 RepID=UPI00403F2B40
METNRLFEPSDTWTEEDCLDVTTFSLLIDVGFLNIDRLRDRKSDRTPATTSTKYGPNPAQIKDFADFWHARHRSLTITEP